MDGTCAAGQENKDPPPLVVLVFEPEITSGSIKNMMQSSQPIEKNSILKNNVETICSDPLISSQVDEGSSWKSPAGNGALVGLPVKASSIQMDSPLVLKTLQLMVNDGFRWGRVCEGRIHMCGSRIPYSARIPEFLQGWAFFEMSEMANLLLVGV